MRNSVKAIVTRLEAIMEQVEEYIDTAEEAEHPNDERIGKLNDEMEAIADALESLNSIE